MNEEFKIVMVACFLLAVLISIFECCTYRRMSSAYFLGSLVGAAFILYFFADFPFFSTARSFGGGINAPLVILLMFVGVILGISATYLFNLAGPFSWRDFLRPVVVSPLVLLPLIGSLQGAALEPVQIICFIVLAFQNGFFWQQVLRDAKPAQ